MQWLRHIRDKNPLPTCGSRCSPGTASPRLLSLPALPAEERGQRPGKQPGTGVTLWAARPHCHGEQLPPEPGLGLCPPPSSCSPAGAHPGSGDEGHPCPPPFVPANTAWPPGWWQQQGQGSACGRALSKPWASVNSFRHVAEGSSILKQGQHICLDWAPMADYCITWFLTCLCVPASAPAAEASGTAGIPSWDLPSLALCAQGTGNTGFAPASSFPHLLREGVM